MREARRLALRHGFDKLALGSTARHNEAMRILVPAAVLLLAGCGAPPPPAPAPAPPPVETVVERGDLIGLDAAALLTRFGRPRLQVSEGDGRKLQFAGGDCVLDAYLYPQGGTPRVTYVDARNREGRTVDQEGCIAKLAPR